MVARGVALLVSGGLLAASAFAPAVAGSPGSRPTVAAAEDGVTFAVGNPSTLPAGSKPAVPYIDRAAKKLHDGTRTVDIAGLVGAPLQLYKVSGGYVVSRRVADKGQLVFISNAGKRTLWETNYYNDRDHPVVVSSRLGSIVYQRGDAESGPTTTVARDVRDGHVIRASDVGIPLGYRGQVLVLDGESLRRWTPSSSAVLTYAVNQDYVQAADLGAGQYFRLFHGMDALSPAPAEWEDQSGEIRYNRWSPDDEQVAGFGTDAGTLTGPTLADAATGDEAARITMTDSTDRVTFETNDLVLLQEGSGPSRDTYQYLVRCSLSEQACNRVRTSSYGYYVLATRSQS